MTKRLGRRTWVAATTVAVAGACAAVLGVSTGTTASSALTTTTLTPVADSYVESTTSTRNYGSSTRLIADASPTRYLYLRFDLSALAGPLQSARLRIHVANTSDAGSPNGGTVARVTETAWTESGITYANRPTGWGSTVASLGSTSRNTWEDVTVTSAVTVGTVLTLGIRTTSSDGTYFDSRETGATAPQLVVTTGTATPPPPAANAVAAACSGQLVATSAGPITNSALKEISGIDAGVANPDVYWAHNDSGDSARVFALGTSGATRATYTLTGASAVDWEDIAVGGGPVAGRSYLYVADIGDNARSRSEVVVYRVAEPVVSGSGTIALGGVEALRLRYPDGAHNAEALLAHPQTGELVIVEKTSSGGAARLYRAPAGLQAGSVTTMTQVGSLTLPTGSTNLVTGADLSADGTQVAVRTYAQVLLWNRDPAGSIQAAFAGSRCTGPLPSESQGEAIAFHPNGRGYVTVSEGSNQLLHNYTAP
jgi:hypothetical protein